MKELIENIGREGLESMIVTDHAQCGEVAAMARALLSVLDAKPVAWISERNLKDLGKAFSVRVKHEPVMVRPVALYTAPPAASVPDGWIKCSERMPSPTDGTVFITWNGLYVGKELYIRGFQCLKPDLITHWMPLPAAPGGD